MNNERTGNILICIISSLFFICIILGGIFLSLYIFLPETDSSPTSSYLLIGMILVATPWLFWIVTFAVRCCCLRSSSDINKDDRYFAKTNQQQQQQHLDVSPAAANNVNSNTEFTGENDDGKSPMTNSPTGGDRHVHFGPVIVLGTDKGNQLGGVPAGGDDHIGSSSDSSNTTGSTKSNEDHSIASTDSERPLACFAVPSS